MYVSWSHCHFCSVCSEGNVRLFGGSDSLSGRVEICRQNEWGTVCATERLWGVESATVVCRQLDYSTEGREDLFVTIRGGICSHEG